MARERSDKFTIQLVIPLMAVQQTAIPSDRIPEDNLETDQNWLSRGKRSHRQTRDEVLTELTNTGPLS